MSKQVEETKTTTISLPKQYDEEEIQHIILTPEEKHIIDALADDSAILIGADAQNRSARFLLDTAVSIAGRHPDADVFLDDVTVSRKHAKFIRNEDGFILQDCNSLNGTYVNTDRIDEYKLKDGEEIRIGKFRFVFYSANYDPYHS
ncbi:MAG: FHA domain-containing protein [Micrococcaceae bacterium]